ncbi:sphingosine 1-phosphate receptor 1 [Striga asiatica]|uniref:Sphingosine 1-phosphate receptor 1 n=1 Tax=Striga asiatica TaxID=4170 RepID=A0A5A7PPV4_STRAF|nr:sphingosine 1-phosphate receptor 1 [Striga asiatica]
MDLSSSSESDHQFRTNRNWNESRFKRPFQIVATNLLSLLLPLSFLLLGRLSTARYLLSASDTHHLSSPNSFLRSFFLSHAKNPTILHLLVSAVIVSALAHALTDKIEPGGGRNSEPRRPLRLWAAWIFLCAAQICVGMGIEGSIAAGVDGSRFGRGNGAICRAVFFVGMHETAVWWWRAAGRSQIQWLGSSDTDALR